MAPFRPDTRSNFFVVHSITIARLQDENKQLDAENLELNKHISELTRRIDELNLVLQVLYNSFG